MPSVIAGKSLLAFPFITCEEQVQTLISAFMEEKCSRRDRVCSRHLSLLSVESAETRFSSRNSACLVAAL